MKVLIATDKFKGSLSAEAACQAIQKGIHRFDPNIETILHPLADGGEGSLDILSHYTDLEDITIQTTDPLGRSISAIYKKNIHQAFIEMASASGLLLLDQAERNPMNTSSYGTGLLIQDAIDRGVSEIYLFIGGSATNDLGIGMAAALGYQFLDKNKKALTPIGANLAKINQIIKPDNWEALQRITFHTICDVNNPLYGKNGAAHSYAAQKGASLTEINYLDEGLQNTAAIIERDLKIDISKIPGSGAAGGMGGGSIVFLGAILKSGIETFFKLSHFESLLNAVDLIFSGEGNIDDQSIKGKVVSGVAQLAEAYQIPLFLVSGIATISAANLAMLKPHKIATIKNKTCTIDEAINEAANRLELISFQMIQNFNQGPR